MRRKKNMKQAARAGMAEKRDRHSRQQRLHAVSGPVFMRIENKGGADRPGSQINRKQPKAEKKIRDRAMRLSACLTIFLHFLSAKSVTEQVLIT